MPRLYFTGALVASTPESRASCLHRLYKGVANIGITGCAVSHTVIKNDSIRRSMSMLTARSNGVGI